MSIRASIRRWLLPAALLACVIVPSGIGGYALRDVQVRHAENAAIALLPTPTPFLARKGQWQVVWSQSGNGSTHVQGPVAFTPGRYATLQLQFACVVSSTAHDGGRLAVSLVQSGHVTPIVDVACSTTGTATVFYGTQLAPGAYSIVVTSDTRWNLSLRLLTV